ncbi:MAG: methyl-accepting chemotaxis protein [Desulfuromonadaceae bacterium]|nr:methyl-accepting chemotaxis protein [Desulfuromonadaceae bacterium]MDD5107415.1 methyl-accepting chemotaxis protein [Desulfuromonadaceae bacterium]
MNLSIKIKIMIIMLVGCISVIIAGALGLYGMKNADRDIETLYKVNLRRVSNISEIMGLMRDNRIQLLLSLQHDPKNPTIVAMHDHPMTFHTDQVPKNIEKITTIWKEYASSLMGSNEKKMANEYAEKRGQFVKEGLLASREAILAGNFEEAAKITITKTNPLFTATNEIAAKMYENEKTLAKGLHEAAISQYHKTLTLVIVAILISITISLILGLLIIRSVSAATSALIKVSGGMAQGDLSHRLRFTSTDELGIIGNSFDAMADSFAQVIRKVTDSSTQVAAAANQLNSNAEQIATGTEKVAAQASTVATAGEEMSATSGDIAQNCQLAAEGAQRASESAQNGAHVVERTVVVMGQIAEKVQESAKTVESLGQRSDQIGAIIGTIEDIADQTNLLALNAAIEAARAGEQGRGFAVVADEVRALAERTTRATREIGEMIKAIQNETKGAVAAMEQGVQQVESGTEEAARSGQALQDILQQVNDVAMQVNQIATAAEEQTATTSEISSNMQQITEVVQQTSHGAQESASAAAQLRSNAEELQRLVQQFKL